MAMHPILQRTLLCDAQMALLLAVAGGWLLMRTLLLVAQASRHTPEAQLARAFQEELKARDLLMSSHQVRDTCF